MKVDVLYSKKFLKMLSKLDPNLQEEMLEKIDLFKNTENHKRLKLHKLKGDLRGCYSFSVNYRYGVLFQYDFKKNPILLIVNDHGMYN